MASWWSLVLSATTIVCSGKLLNLLDRIVVVGYGKSFEDDVVIALNG
jgi:hypothetical protein